MAEFVTKKFLDEAGLKKFWELNKQYTDSRLDQLDSNINVVVSETIGIDRDEKNIVYINSELHQIDGKLLEDEIYVNIYETLSDTEILKIMEE